MTPEMPTTKLSDSSVRGEAVRSWTEPSEPMLPLERCGMWAE